MSRRAISAVAFFCFLGCSSAGSTDDSGAASSARMECGSGGSGGGGSSSEGGQGGSGGGKISVCGDGVVDPDEACDDGKKGICPEDCQCTFKYEEHCYIAQVTPQVWTTAFAYCHDLGMHLTSLSTLSELNYVVGATLPLIDKPFSGIWIGANDKMSAGVFVWDDDEPLGPEAKSMWQPGEPKNVGPPWNCVYVNKDSQLFAVGNCTGVGPFVCESL